MLESWFRDSGFGFFCVQSCLESAFSRMAPKRELRDWDFTELILESDSWCTFTIRWRHFSPQWNTNSNTDDIDTNFWPTVPTVHRFTGGPWWILQRLPTSLKNIPPLSIFMFYFFEVPQLLVEGRNIYYHQFWTHWMKDGLHCLMWLLRKCICF